jgi:hypothetical protein
MASHRIALHLDVLGAGLSAAMLLVDALDPVQVIVEGDRGVFQVRSAGGCCLRLFGREEPSLEPSV